MTEQEINCAIAECLGWTELRASEAFAGQWFGKPPGPPFGRTQLPNFHASLDACAIFENSVIAGDLDMEYREALERECGQYAIIYRATAPQRCQAFLRVKGIWREG